MLGELSLRISASVADGNLELLKTALADTWNHCTEDEAKDVIDFCMVLMTRRQRDWFQGAVVDIQSGN